MASKADSSQRMGDLMLRGWTMMGVSCPADDCYTPLMKNREGKMYCVSCDQYVITEEEAKQEEQRKAEEEPAQEAPEAKEEDAIQVPQQIAQDPVSPMNSSVEVNKAYALSAMYKKIGSLTESLSHKDSLDQLQAVTKSIRELSESIRALTHT